MRLTRNWGMLLLGIWLALTGLIALVNFSFAGSELIMALLALLAGAVILLESANVMRGSHSKQRSIGMILLGIWLLLTGLLPLLGISFDGQGIVMALLALVSGVLILLGR